MNRLVAGVVSIPVLERLHDGDSGVVLGAGSSAAYVDFGGFVVALTVPGVPAMPNGVTLASELETDFIRPGAGAAIRAGGLEVGGTFVDWTGARHLVPSVSRNFAATPARLAARASELSFFSGDLSLDDVGRGAVGRLGESFARSDPNSTARAVLLLLGRGSGLTPEGDDVLTGCAAAIVAFQGPAGVRDAERNEWLSALCPSAVRTRTTALSSTLLELACAGYVAKPLSVLLDLAADPERCRAAAQSLRAVGHSTGRAWMRGSAIAAGALASKALAAVSPST